MWTQTQVGCVDVRHGRGAVGQYENTYFATGIAPVSYGRAIGKDEKREQEMMDNRWRCFHFKHVIQAEDVREIPPCKKCFAALVLTCEDF